MASIYIFNNHMIAPHPKTLRCRDLPKADWSEDLSKQPPTVMVPPALLTRVFVAPTPALQHDFGFQHIPAMAPKVEGLGGCKSERQLALGAHMKASHEEPDS